MADEFIRQDFMRHRYGGGALLSVTPAWLRTLSPLGAAPQILDPVTGRGLLGVSAEIRTRSTANIFVGDVLKAGSVIDPGRIFLVRQIHSEADARLLQVAEIRAPIPDEFDERSLETFWTDPGPDFSIVAETFGGAIELPLVADSKPINVESYFQPVGADFDIWTRLRTDAGAVGATRNGLLGCRTFPDETGVYVGIRDNGATGEPVRYDVLTGTPTFTTVTTTGVAASPATYYYFRLRRVGQNVRTFYKTSPGEPLIESDWTEIPAQISRFISPNNLKVGLFGFTDQDTAGIARWQFLRNWVPEASSIGTDPFSNVVRCIHRFAPVTPVGNVGAGLDSLHSFTLPAGSLANDRDYLHVRYKGDFAANSNTKRVQCSIDAQAVANLGLFSIGSAQWDYDIYYVRLSSTQIQCSVICMNGFINRDVAGTVGGNANHFATGPLVSVSDLNVTDVILLVQGESGAGVTGDVTQRLAIIEICRQ